MSLSFAWRVGEGRERVVIRPSVVTHETHFPPPTGLKRFIRPSLSPSLALLSMTPPWYGTGSAGAVRPASPGTACGIGSASPPWSRRKRERWCVSGRDASCRRTPLKEEEKQHFNTFNPVKHFMKKYQIDLLISGTRTLRSRPCYLKSTA